MGRRRSRRDNSFEIAKLTALFLFVTALALTGGNIKQAVELFLPLAIVCLFLGVGGVAVYFFFRKIESASIPLAVSRSSASPAPARWVSDGGYAPVWKGVPERFTRELLNQLEWRRFEMLVQALFQAEGLVASRIRAGADGGIDLALREAPYGPVTTIVQCKAWKTCPVGVKPVRELFGVMHAEGAAKASFFTSGHFTAEAAAFAEGKSMDLIDGAGLLLRLNALEKDKRDSILTEITEDDYTTPTCPSCDIKMVRRISRHGEFWGCRYFPRCKQRFHIGK